MVSTFNDVRLFLLFESVSCSLCQVVFVKQFISGSLCQVDCVRQTASGLREVLVKGPAFIAAFPRVCLWSFVGWFRI